jgi:hypothetical protein
MSGLGDILWGAVLAVVASLPLWGLAILVSGSY